MNKNLYYSSFAFILRKVVTKYNLTLEQQVQLLLPIGLMNSSEIYVTTLTIWLQEGVPNQNLAAEFFKTALMLYKHVEDVMYPRVDPMTKDVNWNQYVSENNLKILQTELNIAEETKTTQKIIDRMARKITFLTKERANQILQVSILSGVISNTSHNIANQNTNSLGVKHYLKSVNVSGNQKITVLMKNLPNILQMPGQRIESILENWGNSGNDYFDIVYDTMDIYDVTVDGNLVVISKHS